MNLSDAPIDEFEATLPALAGKAFAEARERMLAAGQSVLESEAGMIYETFPDGRCHPVRRIEPPIPMVKGSRLTLR